MSIPPSFSSLAHTFSVTELSLLIKETVHNFFPPVKVRGEISNLSLPTSGHVYFTLRDEQSVLHAVSWRSTKLTINLENGMRVMCSGRLTTYPGKSQYQLSISSVIYDGVGALLELFEKRKKQLEAQGIFALERKKPIPRIPRSIGVITSLTGSVVEDILHRIRERFPCRVVIRDVPVQGREAAASITQALHAFNVSADVDVIIVARGGGSLEDLWVFNEESVVLAVAGSKIPVISGVGHETDTTLTDYAADLRAPTPTAAAELSTPLLGEIVNAFDSLYGSAEQHIVHHIHLKEAQLAVVASRIFKVDTIRHNFERLFDKIGYHVSLALNRQKSRLHLTDIGVIGCRLVQSNNELESLKRVIDSNSIESALRRGFALIRDNKGVISSAKPLCVGDDVSIQFVDGEHKARIM